MISRLEEQAYPLPMPTTMVASSEYPQHGTLNQNDLAVSAMDWTRNTFRYATKTAFTTAVTAEDRVNLANILKAQWL